MLGIARFLSGMFLTVSKLYHNNASSDNIFITFYSSALPVSPNILILIAMCNNYRSKQYQHLSASWFG